MTEGSLEFYCGALGSGKTSFGFDRGLLRLIKGGTVVTNIDFYADRIEQWMHEECGLRFDPSRLIRVEDGKDFWKQAVMGTEELPAMLILDEFHVEHATGDHKKTTSEEILFNTMARKLIIDTIYITQDYNNVSVQFRRMGQKMWYCRNAANASLFGLVNFPFNLFFRCPYLLGPGVPPQPMKPEVCLRPLSWGTESTGPLFKSRALVGKAARTFSVLETAKSSPLERIAKPARPFPWHVVAPVAASAAVFLS